MAGARKKKKSAARKVSPKATYERAKLVLARIKRAPAAGKLRRVDAEALARPDGKSGRGKAVPSNPFTRAERRQVTEGALSPVKRPPKWVYAMIERGASRQDILARAYQRLQRAPTKANHLLVQGLLQEFARVPRGRVKIGKLVTNERLSPFIRKEG